MDWRDLLRKAILVEGSQSKVANKLGYSPATISQTVAGIYPGDTAGIAQKIMEVYGGKIMQKEVPDGYMTNNLGHLVPIEAIKEIDLARDELVKFLAGRAKDVNEMLTIFKKNVADDMQAFFELSAEKYQADVGGSKSFLELYSFDGQYKLVREHAERLNTTEQVHAAIALVKECLREWSDIAGPELRAIVEKKLQINKKGRINIKEFLSLRSFNFDHPKWKMAMQAVGTCTYYRMYERDDEGKYHQIGLDFSGV